MIYDVFLPFIIIFSIFSIIIILARKIPDISLEAEVKKDSLSEETKKQHRAAVLFCKALSILEKTLRQLRIHILKLDAKIFGIIQYLRDKSAKKLEEINKLSYKTFVSAPEKKANKTQSPIKSPVIPEAKPQTESNIKPQDEFLEKPQAIEKDILSEAPLREKTIAIHPLLPPKKTSKTNKAIGYASKLSNKFQFKIEERKLLHIIARNPKIAENYKKLGMLYLENENFLDAEAAFAEYLKLSPADSEIREMVKKIALENQNKKV